MASIRSSAEVERVEQRQDERGPSERSPMGRPELVEEEAMVRDAAFGMHSLGSHLHGQLLLENLHPFGQPSSAVARVEKQTAYDQRRGFAGEMSVGKRSGRQMLFDKEHVLRE